MIKIGLTGNRYSGKNTVSKLFKDISIPVFYADIVLKFILNHNLDVIKDVKRKFSYDIYDERDMLDLRKIKSAKDFDTIVDVADFELRKSYEKFRLDNKNSIYTIFNTSILFERGWNTYMDYTINVFCTKKERLERCKKSTGFTTTQVYDLFKNEMEDLDKNALSTYVLHNYANPSALFSSIEKQVNELDQKIIDKFILKEQTELSY